MQEAKFSLNVRFNYKGYDSQFTMRDDENGAPLLDKFAQVITRLEKMGALPERRWEGVKNGNGNIANGSNGKAQAAPATATKQDLWQPPGGKVAVEPPTCNHCKKSDHMELVEFAKEGVKRKEWKCQACGKWYYTPKAKK